MYSIACHHCQIVFEAKNIRAKFCSGNCRSKDYYMRRVQNDPKQLERIKLKRRQDRELRGDEINDMRRKRFANDSEYRVRVRKMTAKSRQRKPQAENNRLWLLNNPYKAMLKNLRKRGKRLVSEKDLRAIFERDNHTCQYCGCQNDLSLDHKVPVSRGGNSSKENLCLACQSCNSRKGAKTVEEFLAYLQETKC